MDIDIDKVLSFIRDNADNYAEAKANRIYLEEFKRSKKAMLMKQADENGYDSAVSQEREAYADKEYLELLVGLKEAVREEERLRWLLVAAQAKVEAWRTISANERYLNKATT